VRPTARPLADRVAAGILEGIASRLWGFKPNLMVPIIEQKGPASGLTWFLRNMPRYEDTWKTFGAIRTHVLATMISVLNGCRYCTFGQAYALELCYFERHGVLFPMGENQIIALSRLDSGIAVAQFTQALIDADLAEEAEVMKRMLAIRDGQLAVTTDEDRRLKHLSDMFSVLNACGVRGSVEPDQAHDPINRKPDVIERYRSARRVAGR